MNRFGEKFNFVSFGESHAKAIGCVVDGVPAGLNIDEKFIESELHKRRPGQTKYTTSRKEPDCVEIFSGIFNALSTGAPIAMIIYNTNQKPKDYNEIKDLFRPSHADFTYFHKYNLRDHRGGGRSSARETAVRVAAGAIAKLILREVGISLASGITQIYNIKGDSKDFEFAKTSEIFSLDKSVEEKQKNAILKAKKEQNSVGGVALVQISNVPIGLGEPLYYRLDAILASAMMSINAVKAVEIGDGIKSSQSLGSQNNDLITKDGFKSNHSGGILGGISNGDIIDIKVYFKPTPTISISQKSITTKNEEITCKIKGRHDPCVAVRGCIVAESMAAVVIADMLLLNMGRKMRDIKAYYAN